MNYAQKLYQLDTDKETLLQKAREDLLGHFFCFVNIIPIGFMNSKVKGVDNFGTRLNFEIISVDNSDKNEFYSLTFSTTLDLDNHQHLQISHSSNTTLKTINSKGIFFIQHYHDLHEKQKKEFLKSIKDYYQRLQDKQDEYIDSVAISSLETYHIVDYFKSDKNHSLSHFIEYINHGVDNIIEQHLSSFVCQTIKKHFEKTEKLYTLTLKDKKNLISSIQNNFWVSVNESLYKVKREGNYQDDWIISHNQAVEYFKNTDILFKREIETYKL